MYKYSVMKKVLVLFILFIFSLPTNAAFIENKGQIRNQENQPNDDILFIHETDSYRVFLTKQGFSYEILVHDLTEEEKQAIINEKDANIKINFRYHRIDFQLPTDNFSIEKYNRTETKLNYIIDNKIINTSSFNRVVYQNIQPGLHLEFLIDQNGKFKYNIISESSHDYSDFFLIIKGANDLKINDKNQLEITTELGQIVENIPVSYIHPNSDKERNVDVYFTLNNNVLKFSSPENLNANHLVIDPEPYVEWSTYFGGSGFDWGMDIAVDDNENSFHTGLTTSLNNIASSGAFQGSFMGDIDGFLTKFDTDGNLLWSTYFGGGQTDRTYGITTDSDGNIYVAGSTFSTTGIATMGTFQPFVFGIDDMFFIKFDTNGQRVWATYYGGEAHDFPTSIVHKDNNLFFTGHTVSDNNISTNGTFLPVKNGFEVGFLSSITDDGTTFNWGTYIGSNGNTSGEAIDLLSDGRIVVTGRTTATSDIASPGAHQDVFSGFVQSFLMVFNSNGTRDWGTYYGGDFSNEGTGVAVLEDDIFLAGNSNSNNNIATANAYQTTKTDEHGYLAKFNDQGVRDWGTYVGGNMEDVVQTVTAKNRMIIVGGHTRSTVTIASSGAFQENQVGSFDGFLNAFSPSGEYLWGSYLGGVDDENINRLRFLNDNAVVFSGKTAGSPNEITYGNIFQNSYGGGADDAFFGKFFIPCKTLTVPNDFNICEGEVDTLVASGVGEISWYANNVLIATNDSIIVSPSSTTDYESILVDYTNCSDTQNVEITVNPVDDASFTFNNFCFESTNGATNIATSGGVFSFEPLPADGASINSSTGEISNETLNTTYGVQYTTQGACPDSSLIQVTALTTDDPYFEYESLCENEPIIPSNLATSGGEFSFAIPPTGNETIDANTGEIINAESGNTYSVTYITPPGTCQASSTEEITILAPPFVSAGEQFESCIYDDSLMLSGSPMGGEFSGTGVSNNYFNPNAAGLGTHELIYFYTASNGCSNTDTINVFVDECLDVDDIQETWLQLAPNPVLNKLTIKGNDEIQSIVVLNAIGQIIYSSFNIHEKKVDIDFNDFTRGIYTIRVSFEEVQVTKKIIKL
jgi:hypothetical protein